MTRLPIPGGDQDGWGTILNDYLSQSLTADGVLKPNTVTTTQLQDSSITEDKLASDVIAKLNTGGGSQGPQGAAGPGVPTGGTTGQVLAKSSNTDHDTAWVAPSGGSTNLGSTASSTTITITSSTGTSTTIPAATASDAGTLTASDKGKLNGIATGATANATNEQLRDRATHTGTQSINTVTGLQAALDGKAASGHTHTIANVTNLQSTLDGKITGQNGAVGLWIGSQAQYDAIGSKSATTLYVINDA